MPKIELLNQKSGEKVLRVKTRKFDFSEFSKTEINELIRAMRKVMREAQGIGLSANQIGRDFRMFVAELPKPGGGYKFYAIFNPKLEKKSAGKEEAEEGCLSIPGVYASVLRHENVVLSGQDKSGKPLKIKAWGLLARVFQHETDHLDGYVILDRAKKVERVKNE